jgi:hypothetical protein
MADHAGLKALMAQAAMLPVEEILALCFAFSQHPGRLRVYQNVLRVKGGEQAQCAAALICFDRARLGDAQAEAEFFSLMPVLIALRDGPRDAHGKRSMDHLVEADRYLFDLWQALESRLFELDPRSPESVLEAAVDDADILEIDLFDDDEVESIDLAEFEALAENQRAMLAAWERAMAALLDRPATDASVAANILGGFVVENQDDLERLNRFCQDARSLADLVPAARRMLPLAELFLASHLRAKNLFGRKNKERQALIRSGLGRFVELGGPPIQEVTWLLPPTATANAWPKVAEVILDFIAFLGRLPPQEGYATMPGEAFGDAYLAANRPQPPPPRLAKKGERRRR